MTKSGPLQCVCGSCVVKVSNCQTGSCVVKQKTLQHLGMMKMELVWYH